MLRILARTFSCVALVGAALIPLLMPTSANAQTCNTTYSGCAPCVSGIMSEQWCWNNAATPRPFASILMWNPLTGQYVPATCQAAFNLPAQTTCEPPQPADTNQRNVYRFFIDNAKDHFLTLSWSEGTNSGGTYEGIAFKVFVNPIDADMQPIYRCYWYAKSDHFVSTQSDCEGLTNEGTYGYISTIPRSNFMALYRLWIPNWSDHISTTNLGEVVSGVVNEGIKGYVPQ